MTSIIWNIAITCLVIVQAAPDDPGPQIFKQDSPSSQNNQRGFVMKEVTLYLTPSQIRALESSQGDKSPQSDANRFSEQDIQKLEDEIKRQLATQHIYVNDQSDIQRPVPNYHNFPPPQVEEPSNENPQEYIPEYQHNWTPIPNTQEDQKYFSPIQEISHQNPNTKFPESYSFVKIYTDDKVHETPKLQLFHPIPYQHHNNNELSKLYGAQRDASHSKEFKLIPYEYVPDHSPGAPKPEEVKEITKWVTELDQYDNPLNPQITEEHINQEEKIHSSPLNYYKDESHLKYAPNFNDHKHAADYKNFVIRLEKENALARTEAILKAPPVVVRKAAITKRHPISRNKHVSPFLGTEKTQNRRHVWKS